MYPIPSWVYDSVVYQIFPDRFKIGNGLSIVEKKDLYEKRGGVIEKWDVLPKATKNADHVKTFYGGDIWGIIEELDYIKSLGTNCIYLNPIFLSPSNHKYDTVDYFKVDPQFGGNVALKKLINETKKNKIKLVLDGVFNHISSQHPWFLKALKGNKKAISNFSFYEDGYRAWWGAKSLPELHLEEVEVRNYILSVVEHYLKLGIDGWRLDCGQDLGPVNNAVITAKAKEFSAESYVVSELWTYPAGWDMVDGIMNYHFRNSVYAYLKNEMNNLGNVLEKAYRETENIFGCWNMLDSHDTERLATTLPDKDLRKLAIVMQFTYPGVPVVYYGTEIGMTGGNDPECRAGMIWDKDKWDTDLLEFYKKIISIRKSKPALRFGEFRTLSEEPLVYMRKAPYPLDDIIVAINKDESQKTVTVSVEDNRILSGTQFIDLFTSEEFYAVGGTLRLNVEPKSFRILKARNFIKKNYNQYKRIY